MKICTIVNTRPELIRLSRIIAKLDKFCEHSLVYTGQNFDPKLSTIFFEDLGIRKPDLHLGNKSSNFGEQMGLMFSEIEKYLKQNRPDKILVLGDTNGCLCSIIAKKLHIPIFHMEAGNRCGKWIDEEINRRLIDSISDVHLPYTTLSKENLIEEGIANRDIFVVGNPIAEVMHYYREEVDKSQILKELDLLPKKFFLSTFHRNENVTDEFVLNHLIKGLELISKEYDLPVVCSVHPKTKTNLEKFNIKTEHLVILEPIGFFDFVKLEAEAKCIISDSGTCPEEGTILGTPSVIIRETTERPELLQCGSALLSGTYSSSILQAVKTLLNCDNKWKIPAEYAIENVSDVVTKLLLGNIK